MNEEDTEKDKKRKNILLLKKEKKTRHLWLSTFSIPHSFLFSSFCVMQLDILNVTDNQRKCLFIRKCSTWGLVDDIIV